MGASARLPDTTRAPGAAGGGARLIVTVALAVTLATRVAAAPASEDLALYRQWCARCHGEHGDGNGPAAVALRLNGAPPRDFTAGLFRLTSVRSGTAPTDDDLARVIAKGIPATSMPSLEDLLGPADVRRLIGVVRGFARHPAPAGTPVDLGTEPSDDEESRRRGAAAYDALGCAGCHGQQGHGDGPSAATLRTSDGVPIRPADLSRPWTFKGGATARDVATRLATGMAGTPMPAYLDAAPSTDLWDVAHHVLALARAPSLRAAAIVAARVDAGADQPLAARGEYLAKSGTCFLCHVQMQPDGAYVEGSFGAGGMRVELTHAGRVYTRNLTPDPDAGIGRWSADDLRRALRDGRTPTGRVLSALDMPWTILAGIADRDVDALHAYLASLPPVRSFVPPPEAASLADGLFRKIVTLATGGQMAGVYYPGNAGHPDGSTAPVENPRADLLAALGCIGVIVVHRLARRPRGERLAVATIVIAATFVYAWPPLRWMPASLVEASPPFSALGRAFGLPPLRPPPEPIGLENEDEAALARRGRYVATIGTCPLCHTAGPDPLRLWQAYPEMGGGMRVSWKVFGTTYSRNLTPDPDTGLGRWSDAEVKRAITSGIARDGRLMHWQAMPWDHFSRLSPEDLEALVAYLRHLPPLRSAVPPPSPSGPGDADGDSFSFGYSGEFTR